MNVLSKYLMRLNLWLLVSSTAFAMGILTSYNGYSKEKIENSPAKILRVRLPYRLPLDPLELQSMADYDLLLTLTQTWFNYDSSRKAQSGLIKKWSFNEETGEYMFEVDQSKKWSNGDPLISEHFVFNLKRAVDLKSPYGLGISSILDMNSIKIDSHSTFRIKTIGKKPSETFFQRMAAHPLALIHPADIDNKNKVKSNDVSLGPYLLKKISNEELTLVKYSVGTSTAAEFSPEEIIIRKPSKDFDLQDFLSEKTWENITQINTFIPLPMANLLKAKNLPYWTRGHDRVSLIIPTHGKNLTQARAFIKKLHLELKTKNVLELPLNVVRANSLQPLGYPLFNELIAKTDKKIMTSLKGTALTAIATDTHASKAQIAILEPVLKSMGVKVSWDLKRKEEFISLKSNLGINKYDLMLFDFGVADPEASTWMGLVIKMNFVETQESDRKQYEEITKIHDKEQEIKAFKNLLSVIFERGSFLPLFHFSTLSIGHSYVNLSLIKELDETVDYSQVIIK